MQNEKIEITDATEIVAILKANIGQKLDVAVQWYSYDPPRRRDVLVVDNPFGVRAGNEWFSPDSVAAIFLDPPKFRPDNNAFLCRVFQAMNAKVFADASKRVNDNGGDEYDARLAVAAQFRQVADVWGGLGAILDRTVAAIVGAPETPVHSIDPTIARPAVPANKTIGFLIDELDAAVAELAGRVLFESKFKNRYESGDFHRDVKKLTAAVCEKWGVEFGTWQIEADDIEILKYVRPIVEGTRTAQKIGKIDSVFFEIAVEGAGVGMTIDEVVRRARINDRRKALSGFRSQIETKAAEIARISQIAAQYDEDLTALLSEFKIGDVLKLSDGGLETLVEWQIRDFRGGGVHCVAIMNANFSNQEKPFDRVFTVAELRQEKARVVRNEAASE